MNNSKKTRKALLSSLVALMLCFSMLLGTTMAWFTDSASASVSEIKSGTLKVELVDEDGNTFEGRTIAFKKAAEAPVGEAVLWEPGCTYELEDVYVKNDGNLAIKYKIDITGLDGDAALNEVIDWKIKVNDKELNGYEGHLDAGEEEKVTISGTMSKEAGNEYQNKTIQGVAITVTATQDTVEFDSNNNQYDAGAEYDGITIPEDAVAVSNFEEFKNALATGGNYEITAPFTVEGVLNVSADTTLYNADPSNVLTFAQNARLTTAENVDLALYGVKIDGGGSFEMVDGVFNTDTTAKNIDAILKANAGSTLTLGEGTVIENVVSTAPAVAWAKGTVDNRATIILDGATIQDCAGGSGTVINVDRYGDVYIEEGTVITDNVSYNQQNHGIIRIYNDNWDAENASTLTINGGKLTENYFSANGMIGLYYAKMTMNGGEISGNSWYSYNGKTNGFYCIVYVHSNSQFIMNGGEISGNTITDGTINAINSSVEGAITFNGGTVINNSNTRNENKDALAAVCYPYSMQKTLVISENANVTGTVYNHAIEGDVFVRNYSEISEYFGE